MTDFVHGKNDMQRQRAKFRFHFSWLVLLPLLVWSCARRVFPLLVPELTQAAYWGMAAVAGFGLVLSVLVREAMQMLVAARTGQARDQVVLHVFGGIVEDGGIRPRLKTEMLAAAGGFLASAGLGALFMLLLLLFADERTPLAVIGVGGFMIILNWALAVINLIPAYPLAGGRVLRAFLQRRTGAVRGLRLAAGTGMALALILVALGGALVFAGLPLAGLWAMLAGLLILGAAARRRNHAG